MWWLNATALAKQDAFAVYVQKRFDTETIPCLAKVASMYRIAFEG